MKIPFHTKKSVNLISKIMETKLLQGFAMGKAKIHTSRAEIQCPD